MNLTVDPEFQALIPTLSTEERQQLEINLQRDGCLDPLRVWTPIPLNAGGYNSRPIETILIDGHNRYEICRRLGIAFDTVDLEFGSRDDAADWIDANQLGRRNLSPDTFTMLLGRRYNRAKKAHGGDRKSSPQSEELKSTTAESLAAQHGVSRATVERAGQFAAAVETVKSIEPGIELRVATQQGPARGRVVQAAKLLESEPELAQQILSGEKDYRAVRQEVRRAERMTTLAEVARGNMPLVTPIRYPIIYADPPWRYEHAESESRAIENQYPTMSLDDICAMPLGDVTTDDAVLFMWATSPKLAEAMRVVESWGFTYRTCMVWVKDKIGMGYYARQQHELLLIAAKGAPPTPAPADRPSSVVNGVRAEHSAKPEIFYGLIERMYPGLPRIELFARTQREGWASWGNQSAA